MTYHIWGSEADGVLELADPDENWGERLRGIVVLGPAVELEVKSPGRAVTGLDR